MWRQKVDQYEALQMATRIQNMYLTHTLSEQDRRDVDACD